MATLSQFRTEIDQARTAMGVNDYAGARKYLTTARLTLIAIPDSEMTEERLQWQREGLNSLSDEIKRLEQEQKQANKFQSNGPIVFSQIEQVRE